MVNFMRHALIIRFFGIIFALCCLPMASLETESQNANWKEQQDRLDSLLYSPIDLQDFKQKNGPSNSSVMSGEKCFFKPKENGFYYWYSLFREPRNVSEEKRLRGFRIVVYKHGSKAGDFYGENEELIAIKSKFSDPNIGGLNLVGLSIGAIKEQFGLPFSTSENVLVYINDSRSLSLGISNGKVVWFKYVRLNKNLSDPLSIPTCLKKF